MTKRKRQILMSLSVTPPGRSVRRQSQDLDYALTKKRKAPVTIWDQYADPYYPRATPSPS